MEEITITQVDHYHNDDFDELNLRIDSPSELRLGITHVIMEEQHDFHLKVVAKTGEVIGATILEADHWFDEIAAAFQCRDLDHPDVRFFFEQKIRVFAAQWAAAQHTEALAPTQPEPWRAAPVDDPTPATNKVAEAQPV